MKRLPMWVTLLVLCASGLQAQTELKRVRIGNTVESMTYVNSGPHAGHIAIEDGMQVIGFPADGRGNAPPRTLFDFSKLGFATQPTGLGYLSDERLFVFTFVTQNSPTATLYLSDGKGNPAGSVVVNWPQEFAENNSYPEGIVWVPRNEPRFAGCFIFAVIQQFGIENSFLVVSRTGEVIAKITPNLNQNEVGFFPTGLAYRDGHLIVGTADGNLYELDLYGDIVKGPIHFDDAADLEGVAALSHSDRIAITSNANAKLIFLDESLNRLPGERSYRAGLGLSHASDVAWSTSTSEFLIDVLGYELSINLPQIAAVNADVTSARFVRTLVDFSTQPNRLDYLSDTDEFVLFRRGFAAQRGFLFSDLNGNDTAFSSTSFVSSNFTYIPDSRQFVIRRSTPTNVLFIHDRDDLGGPPLRSISLSALGLTSTSDVTYFRSDDPNGGRLLLNTLDRFDVIDLNGNLISQYPNSMHVLSVGAISSGPYAGAFAGINLNNDLVIFTLP
jgi:hypothetical protein